MYEPLAVTTPCFCPLAARDYVVEATFRWELHYYTRDFDALGRLYTDNCTLNPPAWPKIENQMREFQTTLFSYAI